MKRQIRSFQTKGHFGDIKKNENFRRFNYRSKEKVYKEFMLYAIGRNIMKYHRFLQHEIEKYEGKKRSESILTQGTAPEYSTKGFLRLKIRGIESKRPFHKNPELYKSLDFIGWSLSYISGIKNQY